MTEADHANFVAAFEDGKLNKPEWPGHVIAKLSLATKPEVNGKYLRYARLQHAIRSPTDISQLELA